MFELDYSKLVDQPHVIIETLKKIRCDLGGRV